jgi:hypothetical protein
MERDLTKAARIAVAAALFAGALATAASPAAAATPPQSPKHYSAAVAKICAGALLFEHPHRIDTDAGARAAARDIRRSARRRLARVAAIPAPLEVTHLATRWISLQRRQAESYARNWMRIHHAIDAARTPLQRARLPRLLQKFVHAPDRLRRASRRLESALNVPDCTGGDPHPPAVTS